jgi:hypothetical protein
MKLSALRALPEAEQRQVLRDGLKKRAEILSNVHFKVHVENYAAPYRSGKIGDRSKTYDRYDQEFWKLADCYRLKHTGFKGDETIALFTSESGFDARKGMSRTLGKHAEVPYPQARISNEHDNITRFNYYAMFLPGFLHGTQPSHLQYLLDNFDKAELLVDDRTGHGPPEAITLRIAARLPSGRDDVRTYWLAPEKDFMFVRWERRKDWPPGMTPKRFQYTDMWVSEAEEVDSLWVPKVAYQVSWSEEKRKGDANGVTLITLHEMQIGKATEFDLVVNFPDGTEVIDDFTQKAYVVGKSDRPIPLVNLQGIAKHQPKRAWPWGILLNVAVVVGLVGLLIARRRRARLAAT